MDNYLQVLLKEKLRSSILYNFFLALILVAVLGAIAEYAGDVIGKRVNQSQEINLIEKTYR